MSKFFGKLTTKKIILYVQMSNFELVAGNTEIPLPSSVDLKIKRGKTSKHISGGLEPTAQDKSRIKFDDDFILLS